MKNDKHSISVIGAGKVGVAIGSLLLKRGHRVVAATATSTSSLEKAAAFLPGAALLRDNSAAVTGSDIILITTRDEQIRAACDELAAQGAITPGHTVIHMSGAGSLDLLSSAKSAGAKVASLHPIQSFASVELAIEKIPGSYFGLTAEGPARDIALQIVQDLNGKVVEVADSDKHLYHAAACIASNYLVTLLHLAGEVYKAAGFKESAAMEAMMPLVKGTLSNIESAGTVDALTGPIARGDATIIQQHIESLEKLGGGIVRLYKTLGLATTDVAVRKGTLSREKAEDIAGILENRGD